METKLPTTNYHHQRAPRTPESYFNVPESIALLNIVKSERIQSAFQSNRKNHASVWEMVAEVLNRFSARKRSAKQCCNRYENLKKIYTQLKKNPERHVRRNWPYMFLFKEIEEQRGECWGANGAKRLALLTKSHHNEMSYYHRRRQVQEELGALLSGKDMSPATAIAAAAAAQQNLMQTLTNSTDSSSTTSKMERFLPNHFVETQLSEGNTSDVDFHDAPSAAAVALQMQFANVNGNVNLSGDRNLCNGNGVGNVLGTDIASNLNSVGCNGNGNGSSGGGGGLISNCNMNNESMNKTLMAANSSGHMQSDKDAEEHSDSKSGSRLSAQSARFYEAAAAAAAVAAAAVAANRINENGLLKQSFEKNCNGPLNLQTCDNNNMSMKSEPLSDGEFNPDDIQLMQTNYNGSQSFFPHNIDPNILHPHVIVDTDNISDCSSPQPTSCKSKRKLSTSTDGGESTNYELIEYLKRREKRDEELLQRMDAREERMMLLLERTVLAIETLANLANISNATNNQATNSNNNTAASSTSVTTTDTSTTISSHTITTPDTNNSDKMSIDDNNDVVKNDQRVEEIDCSDNANEVSISKRRKSSTKELQIDEDVGVNKEQEPEPEPEETKET